jgi:hypothetical protein
VFFLVFAAVIGAALLVLQRPRIRPLVLPLAAAALLAGLLAVPVVRAFLAAEPIKGERSLDEIQFYSATPVDYIRANPRSVLWRSRLEPWMPEKALFPGAAPLALGIIGLAPPFGGLPLVYTAGLVTAVDGSFGLNGVLYPHLYRWLAPFRGLRSPARFGALVGLSLAILSGFGARRLLRRCRTVRGEHAVFALLVAAVLVDAWPTLTLDPVWTGPPPIYGALENRSDVVLAEFPVRADPAFNAVFMYFSLWHWQPMINGYSGFIPRQYVEASPVLQEFPLGRSIVLLQQQGVTHVTVNCGLRWVGIEDCETILTRVRNTPELTLVRMQEWEGARVALYELAPPAPR